MTYSEFDPTGLARVRRLTARPSLSQLKHQAKDLRIAAREGEPDALRVLRHLRRYRNADDASLSDIRIPLSDAQYALAVDYGFSSWPALKSHVDKLRSLTDSASCVRTIDGATAIDGLQHERWGGGTRRQISGLATLSLLCERFADEVDYDHLMGASGAAFRVQMSHGQLCASSPNANVGFDCMQGAIAAWGRTIEWWSTDEAHAVERPLALDAARQAIGRGHPALHDFLETSLIVGYAGDQLLLRAYSADTDGYVPMERWPFRIGVVRPGSDPERPDPRTVLARSLEQAIQLFETESVRGYACGRAAYAHWCELLADETARHPSGPRKQMEIVGNAFTFACLIDARAAASNYLAQAAEGRSPECQRLLSEASAACSAFEWELRAWRKERALFPWNPESWTTETRRGEIELLEEASRRDAAISTTLRAAAAELEREGVTP